MNYEYVSTQNIKCAVLIKCSSQYCLITILRISVISLLNIFAL